MAEKAKAKKRTRSPNYPLVNLEVAVGQIEALYGRDRRHPVPILIAHERWGLKRGSAAGNQYAAALKSYGLIEVEGQGDNRKLSVTEAGERIVRNAPDRRDRLRAAALAPPIHAELWSKYRQDGLPSDDVIRNYLIWEREEGRFNEDVVDGVICRFRDTIGFANVQKGDIIEENAAAKADPSRRGAEKPPKDKNQKTVATKGPIGMVRDMDIPLQNGGIATFPVPMTPADHRLLKTILDGLNPIHVQEIPTGKVAEDDRAAAD